MIELFLTLNILKIANKKIEMGWITTNHRDEKTGQIKVLCSMKEKIGKECRESIIILEAKLVEMSLKISTITKITFTIIYKSWKFSNVRNMKNKFQLLFSVYKKHM